MTYAPQTWANLDATKPVSAARMTVIETGILNAHVVPAVRVTHSVAQSITTATDTALAFNTERYDNAAMHDTAVNNSRLTCVTPGLYLITGNVSFVANATGFRRLMVRINGGVIIAQATLPSVAAAASADLPIVTQYQLAASDYVELVVHQTSGGALNVSQVSNYSPEFSAGVISYL